MNFRCVGEMGLDWEGWGAGVEDKGTGEQVHCSATSMVLKVLRAGLSELLRGYISAS